jgi:hypothetical protein
MKMRLASVFALALGVAALASASAYAGNGNGNGNGKSKDTNEPAALATAGPGDDSSGGPGNSANAPGQLKKDETPASPAPAAAPVGQDAGSTQVGVKPSNDTAHDTHAAASSNDTKLYGNGKTAGQIAIGNGAAPSTVLHGPGNSQPHKAAPCSGGHEVDVHALKGKRGRGCGSNPPSPTPKPTPDPGKPGDPGHGPTGSGGNTPTVQGNAPSTPGTQTPATTTAKPVVRSHRAHARAGGAVLSATGAVGGARTLPFTGFPIWIVMVLGIGLIALGITVRRRSRPLSA